MVLVLFRPIGKLIIIGGDPEHDCLRARLLSFRRREHGLPRRAYANFEQPGTTMIVTSLVIQPEDLRGPMRC